MPLTVNHKRKRRYNNRRRRGRVNMYALSKRVNMLSKELRSLPETKEHTVPWSTTVGTTPLIYQMDAISQGDTETQRTGIQITPKNLKFYLRLSGENTITSGDANVIRVIVFRWFDNTFPVATDILYNNAAGIFSGYNYIDIPTVWNTKPRFQVLKDTTLTLDEDSHDHIFYEFNHKFKKNAKIHYSGSAFNAIENKNLFYLIVSDSGVVPHPLFSGFSRLTYLDA